MTPEAEGSEPSVEVLAIWSFDALVQDPFVPVSSIRDMSALRPWCACCVSEPGARASAVLSEVSYGRSPSTA
jgi:hypothetical protein